MTALGQKQPLRLILAQWMLSGVYQPLASATMAAFGQKPPSLANVAIGADR